MNSLIAPRLSAMMFLQFFIWGAWYVTAPRALGPLGFAPEDFAWTYSVGPIAGMISPILVGMIADRFFPTERVLAVMHLLAAGAMFAAVGMMGGDNPSPDAINIAFFVHMLCYFPTLALTNSLSMHNVTDSEKQFPLIRVFGTIGWIVAGVVLSFQEWDNKIAMFQLAAGSGVVLGLYSFTLPHTPPPAKGQSFSIGDALGLDALVLLKKPSYLIFMVSSFLICIPLAFYYQMAERTLVAGGVQDTAFKMTFGQMSEIIFMVLMPFFFKRLGVKWMLFVGMLAWVVRYGLFAVGTPNEVVWMLLVGVTLHGICYDFFFVTGQIYTDQVAPNEIRSQAQGMLVLFTLGLGMLIGAQTAGQIEAKYTPEATAQLDAQAAEIRSRLADEAETLSDEESASLDAEARDLERQALAKKDWKNIWSLPAVGAVVILVLFTLLFKDDSRQASDEEASQMASADSESEADFLDKTDEST
ncbi:MAG: nucleoside permease [Planctomycetota bacterium]|jgi:nucleoside transporter